MARPGVYTWPFTIVKFPMAVRMVKSGKKTLTMDDSKSPKIIGLHKRPVDSPKGPILGAHQSCYGGATRVSFPTLRVLLSVFGFNLFGHFAYH
jgi:hypothetical protein